MGAAARFVAHFHDKYPGRVPISVAMGMGLREIYPFVYEDSSGHSRGLAAISVVADATREVVQIFHMSTFVPRRGCGTKMLAELCAVADRLIVTLTTTPLVLAVEPMDRMSDQALTDWYRQHGFQGETLLHRVPR